MSIKKKKISIVTLFMIAIVCVLVTLFNITSAFASDSKEMSVKMVLDNSTEFGTEYKAYYGLNNEITDYQSNVTDRGSYAISNAFDGKNNTFWMTQETIDENNPLTLTVNFSKTVSVGAVHYGTSYYSSNNVRNFSGFPTSFEVYSKNDNEETLVGIYKGNNPQTLENGNSIASAVFTLPNEVVCDGIVLKIKDVTVYNGVFGGAKVFATSFINFYKADTGDSNLLLPTKKNGGNFANAQYIEENSVPFSEMSFRSNCGGIPKNAFDGNGSTRWTADFSITDELKNRVTVTFDKVTTLEAITYGGIYYTTDQRYFCGFPIVLKVYTSMEDYGDSELKQIFASSYPDRNWSNALFQFNQPLTCKRIVLEFCVVTPYVERIDGQIMIDNERCVAVANNIKFFQVISQEEFDATWVNEIFDDYAQFVLNSNYNTKEKIAELRSQAVTSSNYQEVYKPLLDRADAILSGALHKDPHREFTTLSGARNRIEQNGDIVSYARNTLLLNSFGTNRQVLGIGGATGETITIYVDAGENTRLPSIAFTQIYGAWNSWLRTNPLKQGKNVFVFPNFKNSGSYTQAVNGGGPIHLINPYTPEQQNGDVSIYIEGGYIYPVFHDGDDEESFRVILNDYYERLNDPNDMSITIDAFESVSSHIITSCKASLAYDAYVVKNISPQKNVDTWKNYIRGLLKFGGVVFDPSQEHYDERNEHLSINYRAVQPFAGMYAFAATEHIGIVDSNTFGQLVNKGVTGWAESHEFGHTVDNRNRIWGEVTNNMWAIYERYIMTGLIDDRINVTNVSKNLASDLSNKVGNYWQNGSNNCDIWWILEGAYPGYWSKSEQMYCYESTGRDLGKTERMIYYGSLATGDDLSAYFERWGFFMNGDNVYNASNRWTYDKSSQAFKDLLSQAKTQNRISNTCKPAWYVNNDQYRYQRESYVQNGKVEMDLSFSCYDSSDIIQIRNILKNESSYTLILPTPTNNKAHLGYEIQSYIDGSWKVVGFTHTTSFTDTYDYGGETPQYKVYAYDRLFNHTGEPIVTSPSQQTQTSVCRINENYFDSLSLAVQSANNGDIIYILKDLQDGGIIINKNITIMPDPNLETPVTITRNTSGNLLSVSGGYTVTFGSLNTSQMIVSGNGFQQNGTLIQVSGTVNVYNVKLCDNINSNSGGAIYVNYGGRLNLNDCEIVGNSSNVNGGGMYLNGVATVNLSQVKFLNNSAKNFGGAAYLTQYQGGSSFNNNSAKTEVIISNNVAAYGGGLYVENGVSLFNAKFLNNMATIAGGAFYLNHSGRGNIYLTNSQIEGNVAPKGSSMYLNYGSINFNGCSVEGEIYKSPNAIMGLNTSSTNFSTTQFYLPNLMEEGVILFNSINFEETESNFNIYNGYAEVRDGKIYAYRRLIEVTLNCSDGETLHVNMPIGKFTLPERMDELQPDKYFDSWVIGGKTYKTGDEIEITSDCVFDVTTLKYYVVSLVYEKDNVQQINVTQNFVFYLPMKSPEGKKVFSWNSSLNNEDYVYADGVEITSDVTFTAVVKNLLSFTIVTCDETTTAQYEYGSALVLPTPDKIVGKAFQYWLIDGKKYDASSSIFVTNDMTAEAVYGNTWQVVTIVVNDEKVEEYVDKSIIKLNKLDDYNGMKFLYWKINGIKYFAGMEFAITQNTEIVACYETAIADKVTVTYITNKGSSTPDGDVLEPITESVEYNFGETITLQDTIVNDGFVFLYWEIDGVHYNAGQQIIVTQPFTANAVVVSSEQSQSIPNKFEVIVVDGTIEKRYLYEENDIFVLPSDYVDSEKFSYWEIDGKQYQAGQQITVNKPLNVVAKYESDNPTPPIETSEESSSSDTSEESTLSSETLEYSSSSETLEESISSSKTSEEPSSSSGTSEESILSSEILEESTSLIDTSEELSSSVGITSSIETSEEPTPVKGNSISKMLIAVPVGVFVTFCVVLIVVMIMKKKKIG